jgi:4-hydroxy-tetrahydrodipicolinate synthase
MDLGAAGIMIAPPSGLRTESHTLDYFDVVINALGPSVPVCYQDYPTSTGVYISVDTFHRLVDRHPSLVMLKHEDFPGLRKLTSIRRAAEQGEHRRVSILVANAGLYYPLEMRRGADGVMTGFAYPEMLVDVFDLFERGEADAAQDRYDLYLPILRYEYQIGIGLAIRKEILHRRGAIKCAATRLPGPTLNQDEHAELTMLMQRLNEKSSQSSA